MKKCMMIVIVLFMFEGVVGADSAINIPYEEFKRLFEESVQKKVKEDLKEVRFVYTVDKGSYSMSVGAQGGLCEAQISGRVISGKPEPIFLFDDTVIVERIISVTGGALICSQKIKRKKYIEKKGISFLPSGTGLFSVKLSLFIPSSADNRSSFVSFAIPEAVQNSLTPKSQGTIVLTEIPGVENAAGAYHFSPRKFLKLRFVSGRKKNLMKSSVSTNDLIKKYTVVETPPLILDTVYCFTRFEENGTIMSVVRVDVPPEAGALFRMGGRPGYSIWQCRVNGKKVKVYTEPGSKAGEVEWLIPLARDKVSTVSLSLLGKGEKLGIRGRLDTMVPRMGFPAAAVNIVIGLPKRLEMLSFEGNLSPAKKFSAPMPKSFSGIPYYFSGAFYKGSGLPLAVSYQEPVSTN